MRYSQQQQLPTTMRKFFNTAGPNVPKDHYTVKPLARLTSLRQLFEDKRYFILHAPRQTGKTTIMRLFAQELTREGNYIGLYINIEAAQAVRNSVERSNAIFIERVREEARMLLPKEYFPSKECSADLSGDGAFQTFLNRWCHELPKPLVLFIDEADALIGDSLLSLLRQVRSGYANRPHGFPHSLALIGLRDIRDYRIFSDSSGDYVIGGSAFNIKDKSLTIENFTLDEVRALYQQHTEVTGQVFEEEAVQFIHEQTGGQPWLVNAIARQLCFEDKAIPWTQAITKNDAEEKIEELILRRDTHFDQLADKLTEPRVARVIERILVGQNAPNDEYYGGALPSDDVQYTIDLGLVKAGVNGYEIANPIYREIVPRELTHQQQNELAERPLWYVTDDGRLDIEKVLTQFYEFYKRHGEMITKRRYYTEAAHHLMFLSWLQRIVNGGGRVFREYASGLGRMDLLVEFGKGEHLQEIVIELKKESRFAEQDGIPQVAGYAKRMSKTEAYLIIFRRQFIEDIERIGERKEVEHDGVQIHVIWV